jgi:hypothetical protein
MVSGLRAGQSGGGFPAEARDALTASGAHPGYQSIDTGSFPGLIKLNLSTLPPGA